MVEFLVITAIIGIMAGIGISFLKSFQPDIQLNGVVRNLLSDLRYSQQLSVAEQIEYCLQFPVNFPQDRKYKIFQCGQSQSVKEVSLPEEIADLTIDPSLTDNEVRYNPYGAVKESTDITLENTKGNTKTIKVEPSGFVKIQ